MQSKIKTFEKTYCSEELCDLDRDVSEAFTEVFNPLMKEIPVDEHGFHQGSFKVTIEWQPE